MSDECSNCQTCRHLRDRMRGPYTHTCEAFPMGIPIIIWRREFDHRGWYSGDKGIRYEPKRPAERRVTV